MAFWQITAIVAIASTLFVLWPLIRAPFSGAKRSTGADSSQDETQLDLYQEHLADLETSLARGDIDQTQFEQLEKELQKTLVLESNQSAGNTGHKGGGGRILVAIAVIIPIISFALYSQWGAKADWDIYQKLEALGAATNQEEHSKRIREVAVMIQARLKRTPENIQLQNLLAQTSMSLQDYDQAVEAYRAILREFPESPRIMANLAQALFYRAGNVVTPEVRDYTHKALEIAPMMPEMLGLAGIDAKNQGDLRGAISYWKRAVANMDPNSRTAQGYLSGISKAEKALVDAGESLEEPESESAPGTTIAVNVSLGDAVKVQGDETVFIYARAWQGPKMPLAIQKLSASALPVKVELSDAMAMAPGMDINSVEQLELVARISKSGSPAPQSGDWQGSMGPVSAQELDGPVDIVIDQQIP